MSEEVKGVIENLQEYANGLISYICPWEDSIQALLNYINDLQQENERLKVNCNIGNENLNFYRQENQRLKEVIDEITKLVNNYEECEKIIGVGKPMFPLYKLQNIIHKVKEKNNE